MLFSFLKVEGNTYIPFLHGLNYRHSWFLFCILYVSEKTDDGFSPATSNTKPLHCQVLVYYGLLHNSFIWVWSWPLNKKKYLHLRYWNTKGSIRPDHIGIFSGEHVKKMAHRLLKVQKEAQLLHNTLNKHHTIILCEIGWNKVETVPRIIKADHLGLFPRLRMSKIWPQGVKKVSQIC